MIKITVLDGYAANPGDLSWDVFKDFAELTVYDRTPPELVVDDDTTAEMVMASKFRPLVDEFFKARGFDYKVVSKAKASPNCKDTKGLSALLK